MDSTVVPVSERRKPPRAGIGRVKGIPNKTTRLLKDAILEAATLAGGKEGLVGYLRQQAKKNPGPFLSLLGKVLPTQITGKDGGPIELARAEARLTALIVEEQQALDMSELTGE